MRLSGTTLFFLPSSQNAVADWIETSDATLAHHKSLSFNYKFPSKHWSIALMGKQTSLSMAIQRPCILLGSLQDSTALNRLLLSGGKSFVTIHNITILAVLARSLSIGRTRQDKSCPKGFKHHIRGEAQKGLALFAKIHKLFSIHR